MASTPPSPQQQQQQEKQQGPPGSTAIFRRRDKRRHFSAAAIDLRDPFEYVSLAIRFDESRAEQAIQFLQAPLEDGRLYGTTTSNNNSNNTTTTTLPFAQALDILRKQTAPPRVLLPKKRLASSPFSGSNNSTNTSTSTDGTSANNSSNNSGPQTPLLPCVALTPIILSGLLAAIKDEQQQQLQLDASSDSTDKAISAASTIDASTATATTTAAAAPLLQKDVASELVFYCQAMRRAAIHRVRTRQRRRRIQRIVLPAICVTVLLFFVGQGLHKTRQILVQLDYVASCETLDPQYRTACRLAETALFHRYNAYMLDMHDRVMLHYAGDIGNAKAGMLVCQEIKECRHEELGQRFLESPFCMHTGLQIDLVSLTEVVHGRRPPRTTNRLDGMPSPNVAPDNGSTFLTQQQHQQQLEHLGQSTLNRVVTNALQQYWLYNPLDKNAERRVLDVGCGVGGTLFALASVYAVEQPTKARGSKKNKNLIYHGVTASAAEVRMARDLVTYHGLDTADIQINQGSFDDPLPAATYAVAIAIESLAWSPMAVTTLTNIVQSLQPGGILIMVDDVVVNDKRKASAHLVQDHRGSLLTHIEWSAAMLQAGCVVLAVRDLSLEYELVTDASVRPEPDLLPVRLIPDGWLNRYPTARRVVELYQDRAKLTQQLKARDAAYVDTLAYHMYVCRKI